MSFGATLNLIIGLVFAYFLLALIASGVQEVIASVFAWRGTYLSKGIDVIMDNAANATWSWGSFGAFMKAHFTPSAPPTAADLLRAQLGDQKQNPAQATLEKVLSVH